MTVTPELVVNSMGLSVSAEVNTGVPETTVGFLTKRTTERASVPIPRRVGYTCIRLRMELIVLRVRRPISMVPLVVAARSVVLLCERAVIVPLSPPSM